MSEKSKGFFENLPRGFIKTFGCQMNDADPESYGGASGKGGLWKIKSPERADVIILKKNN